MTGDAIFVIELRVSPITIQNTCAATMAAVKPHILAHVTFYRSIGAFKLQETRVILLEIHRLRTLESKSV